MPGWRTQLLLLAVASAVMCAGGAAAFTGGGIDQASAVDGRPHLLIVAPSALEPVADEWAGRRSAQGWRVEILLVEPASPESTDADALRARVRSRLDDTVIRSRSSLTQPSHIAALLLLGDAPTAGFDGLPTFAFDQPDPRLVDRADPRFASDAPFAVADDETPRPRIAVGRVPVRTVDEARSVLAKIAHHEDHASHGAWRSHLTFIAGEGRFGAGDVVLEALFRRMVATMLPPCRSLTLTYASPSSVYCPPPSRLELTIRDRFAEPALLVNYLGHGHAFALDRMHWGTKRVPMLTASAVAELTEARADLPIAFLGCCSSGWFDSADGRPSLAEAMLLAPGAPVAIIAGSRLTHPYGTAAFQRGLIRELLAQRATTVGELHRRAILRLFVRDDETIALDAVALPIARAMSWPASLEQLRIMHARLFNLIGDPSMLVALAPDPVALALDGGMLTARVAGLTGGQAILEIETARESSIHDAPVRRVLAPTSSELHDLERLAGINYPRANARLLHRVEVFVEGEEIAVALPNPLPSGAALVRLHVDGVAADGTPVRAVGGAWLPTEAAHGRD